jgi:hypothetical protein
MVTHTFGPPFSSKANGGKSAPIIHFHSLVLHSTTVPFFLDFLSLVELWNPRHSRKADGV